MLSDRPTVDPMLEQRQGRWDIIDPTFRQCLNCEPEFRNLIFTF